MMFDPDLSNLQTLEKNLGLECSWGLELFGKPRLFLAPSTEEVPEEPAKSQQPKRVVIDVEPRIHDNPFYYSREGDHV